MDTCGLGTFLRVCHMTTMYSLQFYFSAAINTMTESSVRRFISAGHPQVTFCHWRTWAGAQTGQKPQSGNWCGGQGGVLLTGLIRKACSACCLIQVGMRHPGVAPPSIRWALPRQENAAQACPLSNLLEPLFNWSAHFQNNSSSLKLT